MMHRMMAAGLAATGLMLAGAPTVAQEWAPTKPIKIVVPIVGSTNDALARLIAPKLQEALGQPVVVENKPGAGGNIGADFVAKSPPDGHTLLVGYNGPLAINPSLFAKMPYDPQKDLAPITLAVKTPQYLVAGPAADFSTAKEFIAKAKASPGKYSYASVAMGSASHLTMEMLKAAAGISVTHVPYKGATPAVTDLLGGNVEVAFMVPGNVQQFVVQGRLKLLATTGEKRFRSSPNVPTLIELGYRDLEATGWVGLLAPAGTPKPIIERYYREIAKILNSPDMTARLHDMEFEVIASTPDQFATWIASESRKWGAVVKATGAKAE
ncbi:tripartite tricarboxylate transporter substrate binding protein [Variovorax gossypii]|uniref:Tripartite tricarboxylate transporter substrate binding protein n=1 Tax=Variovorax gossypii TaxID=1679495 RepID=A0A3S0QBJ5_9BURK|nr:MULTISPECIES: tripartite tricarboxylate transporter substrate binding protein [Variovorax]MDR6522132.1 tripartite-type tricarboxylate transporter receptor subunit TctC [Variovorax paradoxus]RTQ35568.1 tripartite tricarboxylate transporter substrate binding protein [Variovorax gossypii]